MSNVAVIGTGLIGTVLTGHLVAAGDDVGMWNRTTERAAAWRSGEIALSSWQRT